MTLDVFTLDRALRDLTARVEALESRKPTWNPLHVDEMGPIRSIATPIDPPSPFANMPPRACSKCGATWTIARNEDSDVFACPNGHGPVCTIPSRDMPTIEGLQADVARLTKERDEAVASAAREGLNTSDWMLRTDKAESERDEARKERDDARRLYKVVDDRSVVVVRELDELRTARTSMQRMLPTEDDLGALESLARWLVRNGPDLAEHPAHVAAIDYIDRLLAAKDGGA